MTADQSTVSVSPVLRRKAPPRPFFRTKTRSISHSRRAGSCRTATSRTVTSSPVSLSVTRRSRSSPRTSRSVGRCSKRRTFSTPVVMTCPDSMPVTRVMGMKTRRRVVSSTTRPSSRGGRWLTRSMATRSRTRPTWSPFGSKTAVPARCETKTRAEAAAIPCLLSRCALREARRTVSAGIRIACSDALQASPSGSPPPWWGVRTDWLRRGATAPVRCRPDRSGHPYERQPHLCLRFPVAVPAAPDWWARCAPWS